MARYDLSDVKVGILAGGLGSRLSEETETRPKPMVEIGGMPILWHIMKIYAHYGFNDFSIALGYKGEYIKRWFREYFRVSGSISISTRKGELVRHSPECIPDWNVDLVETGTNAGTGGRIKKLSSWLGDRTMMVTWGDGVADIDIGELLAFHKSHGKLATLTAVRPPARYGHLQFDGEMITDFTEKPQIGDAGFRDRGGRIGVLAICHKCSCGALVQLQTGPVGGGRSIANGAVPAGKEARACGPHDILARGAR